MKGFSFCIVFYFFRTLHSVLCENRVNQLKMFFPFSLKEECSLLPLNSTGMEPTPAPVDAPPIKLKTFETDNLK